MQGIVVDIEIGRMDHHRRIDTVERAFARDHLLAAETLFRRRAEITHAARQTLAQFRQRERRAQVPPSR